MVNGRQLKIYTRVVIAKRDQKLQHYAIYSTYIPAFLVDHHLTSLSRPWRFDCYYYRASGSLSLG